ncbi:MAG: hypothetical protein L3K08_06905 [Thermoplasmata archaeon]|nr:hypothetical protein [Thermoplasmata archaeon]
MTARVPAAKALRYGLVAFAVAVGIVGVALWGSLLQPTSPPGPVGCPCGSGMAIGTPSAEGGPGNYSYVMGFTPSSGLTWGEARFEITSSTGQVVSPSPNWTVHILGSGSPVNTTIATFGFQSDSWSSGDHVLATSGQSIDLELGSTNLRGLADHFLMFIAPWAGPEGGGMVSTALP